MPKWVKIVGVVIVLAILGNILQCREKRAARSLLDEANTAWSSGQHETAAAKYKSLVAESWEHLSDGDAPVVLSRLVDFHAEKNDAESAQQWLKKADDKKITLTPETSAGKAFLVKVEEERKKRIEEEKAASVAKSKLPAFKALVKKYKNSPDRFASGAEREEFNEELSALQNEFSAIAFDPTTNRDEAKQIITLFEGELEGKYQGQLYRELEEEVREMYSKMTQ